MYYEVTILATILAALFAIFGVIFSITSRNATLPLILAGLIMLFTGLVMADEGMDIKYGEYAIDSQTGNCTTYTSNQTLSQINYTSNMTHRYLNQKGGLASPTDPMNLINLSYIFGGLFFIFWGALVPFQTKSD